MQADKDPMRRRLPICRLELRAGNRGAPVLDTRGQRSWPLRAYPPMPLVNLTVSLLASDRSVLWRSPPLEAPPAPRGPPPAGEVSSEQLHRSGYIEVSPPAAVRARFVRLERNFDEARHAAPLPEASDASLAL